MSHFKLEPAVTRSTQADVAPPDTRPLGGSLHGQPIGYVRFDSFNQHPERPLDGVAAHCVRTRQALAQDRLRPALDALLAFACGCDTVVVHSEDTGTRNPDDVRWLVHPVTARDAHNVFVKEGSTFTGDDSPVPRLMLSLTGAFADSERALVCGWQRGGVPLAEQRRACPRCKTSLTGEQVGELNRQVAAGAAQPLVARDLGIILQTRHPSLKQA